jgi:hypothetical protein
METGRLVNVEVDRKGIKLATCRDFKWTELAWNRIVWRALVLSVMDTWVLFPERWYLGFLSISTFYFYLLNFMRFVTKCWIFRVGGSLHSDVSSWTERRPCFRNMNLRLGYISLQLRRNFSLLKLAKICYRTIVTTDDAHKVYFAFTKTITTLKLI